MAEATVGTEDAAQAAELQRAAREIDRARMIQIGSFHFAMVTAAITLWGAAQTWADATGWVLAHLAALSGALVAGFVVPSTLHEWGHFAGARLSGAVSPVLESARRHFFMFDFDMAANDARQFLWMSWGGILAPWVVVFFALFLVPLGVTSGAVLFATLVARAVSTTVFEGPIAQRTERSGEPGAELGRRLQEGGLARGRRVGATTGGVCFVLLWLVG